MNIIGNNIALTDQNNWYLNTFNNIDNFSHLPKEHIHTYLQFNPHSKDKIIKLSDITLDQHFSIFSKYFWFGGYLKLSNKSEEKDKNRLCYIIPYLSFYNQRFNSRFKLGYNINQENIFVKFNKNERNYQFFFEASNKSILKTYIIDNKFGGIYCNFKNKTRIGYLLRHNFNSLNYLTFQTTVDFVDPYWGARAKIYYRKIQYLGVSQDVY